MFTWTDGTFLVKYISSARVTTSEFYSLPSQTFVGSLPGAIRFDELGDGYGFHKIEGSANEPFKITRYNLDLTERYSFESPSRVLELVLGPVGNDRKDKLFLTADSLVNGENYVYISIVDSAANVTFDTLVEKAGPIDISAPQGNLL